jgi:hypothetical protein
MVEEPSEEDGEPSIVWVLHGRPGLEAGGRAQGLALRCLDEVGRPSRPIKGRLQVGGVLQCALKHWNACRVLELGPLQQEAVAKAGPGDVKYLLRG